MKYFAGIDIGTSAVKVIIIDEQQNEIQSTSVLLEVSHCQPGWSEQNPDDWWQAVLAAFKNLKLEKTVQKSITAIAVSGQMHGLVALDENRKPVCPSILWSDARAAEEAEILHRTKPHLAQRAGVLPMAGLTAPKLLWLKRHCPQLHAQIRWLLSAKDYVNMRLTGLVATDYSDAAGSWFLDQEKRCWLKETVHLVGLQMEQFPEIRESCEPLGCLTTEAAKVLRLSEGTIVATGGGDTPVGAAGLGCVAPGQAEISLGTSAHLFISTEKYVASVENMIHSFCHVVPNTWFQMAAMLNGAAALAWGCGLMGEDITTLEQRIAAGYRGASDTIFLPYLAGERTPHNNPQAKGVFFGMTSSSTKEAMAQAIMEGVAFTLADGCACLKKSGSFFDEIAIAGGGAKSRVWCQIISTILSLPIVRYKEGDKGPAFGAARLAMLAVQRGDIGKICNRPEVEEVIEPEKRYVDSYKEKLDKFRRLYKKIETEF